MFKVKEVRLKRKMSQEELSQKSHVSRAIISNLENNATTTTTTDTLIKIAGALECLVSDIFLP